MGRKNIFVMGLDDFNHQMLSDVSRDEDYEFHALLTMSEIMVGPCFDINHLLSKARKQLNDFKYSIDAIVGYWDFPTVLMMPILRSEFNLSGPSLESVLKCEHKYLSRLEQQKIIPQHIPRFSLLNPADKKALSKLNIPFPLWIKPVKAHSSMFGFQVNTEDDFYTSTKKIAKGIKHFAKPLNEIMTYAHLQEDIPNLQGENCIAESIISSEHQCTLEGYVFVNTIEIYGIIDSIRGQNNSSFESYQYPSQLNETIQSAMKALAHKVIEQIGIQNTPFNIEFFYGPGNDRISLLEINARISKSHSLLFKLVDGLAHDEVMLDVALGKKPSFPYRQGKYRYAAKFMPRLYGEHDDTIISRIPSEQELQAIEQRFPGSKINLNVKQGMRLSELFQQDSYSYQLATIHMGANDHKALSQRYHECLFALDIQGRSLNGTDFKLSA